MWSMCLLLHRWIELMNCWDSQQKWIHCWCSAIINFHFKCDLNFMLGKQAGYRLVFLFLESFFRRLFFYVSFIFFCLASAGGASWKSCWWNCTTAQNKTPVALEFERLWRRPCSPDLTKMPESTSQSHSLTLIARFYIAGEGKCFWMNKRGHSSLSSRCYISYRHQLAYNCFNIRQPWIF